MSGEISYQYVRSPTLFEAMYKNFDKASQCGSNSDLLFVLNLLNHTGCVMHQQFNIQQLYALPTLYLCVLYLSENKQRLVPLTA
jgi:hypothetical protein